MFVIVKNVKKKKTGVIIPVILLNTQHEVWEFDTIEEAETMSNLFETNSDSGHSYVVKKI
jgi:hypothetical protein